MVAIPAVGEAWARGLYAMFAPIREEAQTMNEAEIDALVNEALDEVRSQGDDAIVDRCGTRGEQDRG